MIQGTSYSEKQRKKKEKIRSFRDEPWIGLFITNAEIYLKKLKLLTPPPRSIDINKKNNVHNCQSRHPRRNFGRKSYKAEDISSEDDYLNCDECDREYKGDCPVHGPMLWVCDRKTSKNTADKSRGTLPRFLSIGDSSIPDAGLGIWTEIPLPRGMVFGAFKGTFIGNNKEAQTSGYTWEVRKGNRAHHFIEGKDRRNSSWLRFVNCPDREERQNLVAFQYKKQIYYKTYKPVLPFTELLVWYGDEYAEELGIDIARHRNLAPPKEIVGFECDVCKALFSSLETLQGHRKRHPHLQSDRRYRCPHCPYSTDQSDNLQRHLLTHTGERPHACPHCKKAFTQLSNLQRHLRIHTKQKPFSCSTCGKAFFRMDVLRTHERVHSGERPHICPTCGGNFKYAGALKKHEMTHTLQKPHRCPHCEYRSTNSSALKKHIVRMHTKDFRHVCSVCGKGDTIPSRLRKHMEKEHQLDQKT